jgi:hypothetical protein
MTCARRRRVTPRTRPTSPRWTSRPAAAGPDTSIRARGANRYSPSFLRANGRAKALLGLWVVNPITFL